MVCNKSVSFGRNIRHKASGGWARRAPKTNRTFKPNVQKTTIMVDGEKVQIKVCTSACAQCTGRAEYHSTDRSGWRRAAMPAFFVSGRHDENARHYSG